MTGHSIYSIPKIKKSPLYHSLKDNSYVKPSTCNGQHDARLMISAPTFEERTSQRIRKDRSHHGAPVSQHKEHHARSIALIYQNEIKPTSPSRMARPKIREQWRSVSPRRQRSRKVGQGLVSLRSLAIAPGPIIFYLSQHSNYPGNFAGEISVAEGAIISVSGTWN